MSRHLPVVKTTKRAHDVTNFGRSDSHHPEANIVEADASRADDDGHNNHANKRQLSGAAVGAGLAGLALGGPLLGIVAAGGAAAVATSKGQAGEVARKGGDVVADAGKRLKKFNEKHKVTEKTSKGVVGAGKRLSEFNQKHKVTEKTSKGIIKGCEWVSEKLNNTNSSANSSSKHQ